MIINEVELSTSAEVCTQITSYFNIVDTNKQYTISPQTSYDTSSPIPHQSYTSPISPNTHNTIDIYNGSIKPDLEVKVKMVDGDSKKIKGVAVDSHRFDRVWF